MTWTDGYVTEIDYVPYYHVEFNPQRQRLACIASGLSTPEAKIACELGFGLGLSVNIHAAASATEWWGTDFNPAQAGFAQELAELSGCGAKLFNQAFAEFCARSDLPDFDMIGMHGIWSWVSDENKAILVDFIRRRLKAGGVLYISYNTPPGWAAFAPVQHLMKRHTEVMSASGLSVEQRIDAALAFMERLLDTNPLYLRGNSAAVEHLKRMKEENRRYLAHEYLNANWSPVHVADLAKWLEPAMCSFACSANFIDHLSVLNLTPDQQELLKGIPDVMFRQTLEDFMVNARFRRDYWVKGARRLSPVEKFEALCRERVILTVPRAEIPRTIQGARAKMDAAYYDPIVDLLADYRPWSLPGLQQALRGREIPFTHTVQAVMALAGAGCLEPVQDEQRMELASAHTDKLNQHLMNKARDSDEISVLASTVTGGGFPVPRFQQLFLLAGRNGHEAPKDRAAFAWSILSQVGQKLIKDGKAIETSEDNLAELTAQAQFFVEQRVPILKALGIT